MSEELIKRLDEIGRANAVDYPMPSIDEPLARTFHEFLYEKKAAIDLLLSIVREQINHMNQLKSLYKVKEILEGHK